LFLEVLAGGLSSANPRDLDAVIKTLPQETLVKAIKQLSAGRPGTKDILDAIEEYELERKLANHSDVILFGRSRESEKEPYEPGKGEKVVVPVT
jgi:hypothetical protein